MFNELVKSLNINLTKEQENQFKLYYEFLVEYNEKVNLTSITNEIEVYIKHFYDSLTLNLAVDFSENNYSLLDVGSGAGFPSIPLKIVFPNLHITIIESLNKRIKFLQELIQKLNLDNVTLICGRAEDEIKDKRESFDIVTARAVSKIEILNELCIPYVKVGGLFIAMKSNLEDADSLINAYKLLGASLKEIKTFGLPNDMGERSLIIIYKEKATNNKYPRMYGVIKKKPLV